MLHNAFVFDIETIPQRAPLSDIQEEELERRIQAKKNSFNDTPEELRKLIMGTTPQFGEIVCISYLHRDKKTGEETVGSFIGDETEILTNFWNKISRFIGMFIHFNGLHFDVPWVIHRSMYHRIKPTNKEFMKTRRFQTYPHFDVKQILADWNWSSSISLNLACDFLDIPSTKDGPVNAKTVAAAFAKGQIDLIAEYCEKDVAGTFDVFKIVHAYTP
tara:strand:- start:1100 stop:1750 length:651 start_codon:yes stop_codon:yes gene_type:complete